ncbi:unnamed protein product, partial [Rotaria sordida]
ESNFEKVRTFQLELNEFSDWTLAEFDAFKNGLNVPASLRRDFIDDESDEDEAQRSLSKLYQRHYHVRRLKRNLTTHQYKHRQFFHDGFDKFANRDNVDCSSDGNDDCNGGDFPPSVSYLSAKGGKIATEASYPYGGKKELCRESGINEIEL